MRATFFRAVPARALVQDCVLRGLHALQEAEGLSVEMVSPDLGQCLSPGFPLCICVIRPFASCLRLVALLPLLPPPALPSSWTSPQLAAF